ncbi:MAG: hypothetical protein ACJZ9F_00030 [Rhodospirillaceae bacterium]
MNQHKCLRAELLKIIETHKEGFASGTPESRRINALIDELAEHTPYPRALDHADVYRGHWVGNYYNFGRLVGGDGLKDQGTGLTTSLRAFSMGRLPDVPATHAGNALEINPTTGQYNFYGRLLVGEEQIDSHHFTYGRFTQKEENPSRFYVEFDKFEIAPADPSMSPEDYCKATGIDTPEDLAADLVPSPRLWSDVVYMDDDMRIQLGQLGGYYILFRKGIVMYSVEHASGKLINPPPFLSE